MVHALIGRVVQYSSTEQDDDSESNSPSFQSKFCCDIGLKGLFILISTGCYSSNSSAR